MGIFSSAFYVVTVVAGCVSMLALASASRAEVPMPEIGETKLSPYDKDVAKKREEKIKNEYFNRAYVPGVQIIDGGGPKGSMIDGLNLENDYAPSREDAEKPIDPRARKSQELLEAELQNTRALEKDQKMEEIQIVHGKGAGSPSTLKELSAKISKEKGLDKKIELTPEQIAKARAMYRVID